MNRQGILDSSEPECSHEGYIAEKHVYCPDCGDAGAEMLLQERIAELEAENQRARDEVTRLEGIIASWGEHTQMYEARITELEAACEKAEYELDWHSDELRKLEAEEQLFNNTFDAQQAEIEQLRADNQRLRDALEIIAGKRQCVNNLMGNVEIAMAALLGGGENG